MNQSDFFARLGAPLNNFRWSWGAVRQKDGAVFLRVWKEQPRTRNGGQFVHFTLLPRKKATSPGHKERVDHLDLIRGGAKCFFIIVESKDRTSKPRRVSRFNESQVFPGGRVEELNGKLWIEMLPGIPVEEIWSRSRRKAKGD